MPVTDTKRHAIVITQHTICKPVLAITVAMSILVTVIQHVMWIIPAPAMKPITDTVPVVAT